MLQDRLEKIKNYFQSMEQMEGKWVICISYPPKWGAYPSSDGKIQVVEDEDRPNFWWYYPNDEKIDIDKMFDLVDETIQTNLDAIKKVELFKEKAEELKSLFSDETITLSKLQTLNFTFKEEEINKKKKFPIKKVEKKKITSKKEQIKEKEKKNDPIVLTTYEKIEPIENIDNNLIQNTAINDKITANDLTSQEINDLRG